MNLSALVLAAGSSRRFGGEVPKVFADVGGQSVLERSLRRMRVVLDRVAPASAALVMAVRAEDRSTHLLALGDALDDLNVTVVDGGATRQESMQNALAATPAMGADALVLVHDAARPFFPIDATLEAVHRADEIGAALLAIPLADTLKRVDEHGLVIETMSRDGVWLAQTPQVLKRDLLETAVRSSNASHTDDVGLLEGAGHPVAVVRGGPDNLKITTPRDLMLAEQIAMLEDAEA